MNKLVDSLSKHRTYIMGLAMISIMLCHQVWIKWLPFWGFRLCGNMGVDIFYFVSGFGVVYSLRKHSVVNFYERLCKRIMPLCLFCGVIKYLLSQYGGAILHSENISWMTIWGWDLWFLVDLWFFYLLTPLIFQLVNISLKLLL